MLVAGMSRASPIRGQVPGLHREAKPIKISLRRRALRIDSGRTARILRLCSVTLMKSTSPKRVSRGIATVHKLLKNSQSNRKVKRHPKAAIVQR